MLDRLNIKFFILINNLAGRDHILDGTIILLAQYMPFLFVLILAYLWFKKAEYRNILLFSGYSAILGITLNFLITLFYFHPRPFMDNLGISLIKHASETSFPSDHTTFMFAIAFMFLYSPITRKVGTFLSILALIGGLSRIYTGLHYPFDIAGSFFMAAIASFSIYSLRNKLLLLNKVIIKLYLDIYKTSKSYISRRAT